MYEFRTLGTVELIRTGGERIRTVLAQSKRLALLAYLAAARPAGAHRRDTLVGLFWPDLDQDHARAALRNAVYFLRRSLGKEVLVNVGDADVALDPVLVEGDVRAFEAAVEAGNWLRAMDLYGGDFLKGFFLSGCPAFDHWVDLERGRIRGMAADAGWALANERIAAGELAGAERVAHWAMGLVPTNESAVRSFMEALALGGDRAGALRVYDRFARVLRAELEVDPSAESRATLARVSADTPVASRVEGVRRDARPSVAVLPFLELGDTHGGDHLGLGVMEDILARLTGVRGLRVASRTSSIHAARQDRSAPELARELGVRTILEGSLRRSGDRVRVVAQLIDGETDEHLWAESFDRNVGDIFEVQTEVAETIVRSLRSELSDEDRASLRRLPTHDLAAWSLYVRAVQAYQDFEPAGVREAITCLEEACRLDPGFAKAWALCAQVRVFAGLCADEPPSAFLPKIAQEAERALELDNQCGEAHAAMGVVRLFHEWSPDAARGSFSRALALNPDDSLALGWTAILDTLEGDPAQGVAVARQAIAADPLSAAAHLVMGQVLVMAERLDEGLGVLEAACREWPKALQLRMWLGLALMMKGDPEAALPHYDWAVEHSGHLAHFEALRATTLVALGRTEEGRTTLEELRGRAPRGYVDPYSCFIVALALDGPDGATPYLEQMVEVRSLFLPYLRGIPRFRGLAQHPAFAAALERVWPGGEWPRSNARA